MSAATIPRLKIAVAGATGRVGAALLASLAAEPVELLALTRTPATKDLPAGVGVRAVDFDAPATLREALQGVDRLFLAQGSSPRQVDNEIALIDGALAAGVKHIVKLSALGLPLQLHPFDWHTRIETHLAVQDIGYTMLRPTTFMNVLALSGPSVARGDWGGAAGQGVVNLIDVRDVADVAKVVLLEQASTTWQRAFHLTGARAWSMQEIAEALSRLLGKPVPYHPRTPAQQRDYLIGSGVTAFSADVRVGLEQAFYQSALREDTSTVQLLTGHAPRSLDAWLSENLALFQGEPQA